MGESWFFYFTAYSQIGTMLFQLLIIAVFLPEFAKKKSELKTSYFVIFVCIYGLDVLVTAIFTVAALFQIDKKSIFNEVSQFTSWYFNYSYSYWNVVLAFNRCTAFAFPKVFKTIWRGKWLVLICLTLVFSPFLFDPRIYVFYKCRFSSLNADQDCTDYWIVDVVYTLCFNLFFAVLSLLLIVYGLWRYQPFQKTKRQNLMEKRLIFQSLSNSIIQAVMFGLFQYGVITHQGRFFDYGNLLFVLDHVPSIVVLFLFCPPFRKSFFKFCNVLKIERINAIWSTEVTVVQVQELNGHHGPNHT